MPDTFHIYHALAWQEGPSIGLIVLRVPYSPKTVTILFARSETQ